MKSQNRMPSFVTATVLLAAGTVFSPGAHASGSAELFLDSIIRIDTVAGEATLPLYQGRHGGQTVYYIITESSDREDARRRGVNHSPKLVNALGTAAVQEASRVNGQVVFPGTVDFTPQRAVQAGPNGFPPVVALPGSTGDSLYSPLITTGDGIVLNAPQVANDSGLHDKVLHLDPVHGEVTIALTPGFYHGKRIDYLSTEASDPGVAALEGGTFTPNLDAAPGIADNDPATSARSAIVPIVNGALGVGNPDRQGLASAVLGEGSPLNITEIHPRNKGSVPAYSPLWDVHPAVWSDAAIAAGERRLLDHHEDVADAVAAGSLLSGGAGPANPALGGLRAAGFIVNCPVFAME